MTQYTVLTSMHWEINYNLGTLLCTLQLIIYCNTLCFVKISQVLLAGDTWVSSIENTIESAVLHVT